MSTKLEPEIMSVVKTYRPGVKIQQVSSQQVSSNWYNLLAGTEIPIDHWTVSPAAIIDASLENDRRRRSERIWLQIQAVKSMLTDFMNDPVAAQALAAEMQGKSAPSFPVYAEPPDSCPQFREIEAYLFRNRLPLALDTTGWLPENTMYYYILENGGLNITLSAWRSSL
jgi:hypothetical protein